MGIAKEIQCLQRDRTLSEEVFYHLMEDAGAEELHLAAREVSQKYFGKKIYIRGLIEISNICRNDCLYCGIRKSNSHISRYRLQKEQILQCCDAGFKLGFRTFVLQGGEDSYYSDSVLEDLIHTIKKKYPDCAITLSLGERSYESYLRLYRAGADRYLLRHETADKLHYESLHPETMSYENRIRCLQDLKAIGYQTGCGMMVGSPGQSLAHLYKDILFMQDLQPHMIGIGPFIVQKNTPFKNEANGSVQQCLRLLSIVRLLFPNVLLPATTALGTLEPEGRIKGILAGANVLMPNLSPLEARNRYTLYDNKLCTGEEAAEYKEDLERQLAKIGYEIPTDRGDYTGKGRFDRMQSEALWIAKESVITGDVTLGKDSSVYYHAVLRGDVEPIVIGERTNIQDNCTLHVDEGFPLVIGDDVTVGHGAILHGCRIGSETVIGMGSIVMNGAVIGKQCMVGAGSLITQNKQFDDGMLIMGNPARAVRKLNEDEISHIKNNSQEYLKLAGKMRDAR